MTSMTPTPEVEATRDAQAPPPRRSWVWALVVAVVVLGGLTLIAWLMPVDSATQEEAFDGEVDRLVIEVTGQVILQAGEVTELTITKKWGFGGEPTIEIDHTNGVARITSECPWFRFRCITSVSGTVASDAEVEVMTSAGSIEVSGTTNGVDLETSAGYVRAADITGPARLVTSAGNISGTVNDGDVDAETSAGRIELTVLGDFTSLSARTSAGSVELVVSDNVYDVDADTSAGSVNIGVRTDPSAGRQIIAESSAGSITIRPAP